VGKIFKISGNITTFMLTRGLFIAFLSSTYLYLSWIDYSSFIINTIFGILSIYLLLISHRNSWFFGGFFIGLFWFWWISMSFRVYGFPWAIPIGILLTALVYGIIFWIGAYLSDMIERVSTLPSIWSRGVYLLLISYIHPFGFDWFKMELIFVESYIGVEKWQFAIVILSIILSIQKRKLVYLLAIVLAYQPTLKVGEVDRDDIELVTTHISIEEKFDPAMLSTFVDLIDHKIDIATDDNKSMIIFPESILPIFLNKEPFLLNHFRDRSDSIAIILGALRLDETIPRNSTYIFHKGRLKVADKVVLVPFGESNPLPDWLGRIVNEIFYDGAVDYKASSDITDYTIDGIKYRNAICYEACSIQLYQDDPKYMIVISNNGWFVPSIEPTEQRLLLQYYSKLYGTTIYHSINMSPSYIIRDAEVLLSGMQRCFVSVYKIVLAKVLVIML